MLRLTAVSAEAGSSNLWVGRVTLEPGARSGAHHHGDSESVICVLAGRIRLRFGDQLEESIDAGPGDYVYVPPQIVHQEINLSDSEGVNSIVVRDSQENVVVNVDLPEKVVRGG
jgi:uncharacterized RmlC-like cupin family protein